MEAASPWYRFYRFLGSLWFLLILLTLIGAILILAMQLDGYDITIGALRGDWYGSWWFNILLGLLMVNLTVCTVVRAPWRNYWQWGFLITHSGILTLMIGAGVTFNSKIYGSLPMAEGEQADWFEIEHERELLVRVGRERTARFDPPYNRYRASSNPVTWRVPGTSTDITIDRHLPNVDEPRYIPSTTDGTPAAELVLHDPDQAPRRFWLLSGQETTYQGMLHFSFAVMEPDLWANLSEPAGEQGTLVLTLAGESREIDVKEQMGKSVRLGSLEFVPRSLDAGEMTLKFDVLRDGKVETWAVSPSDKSPRRTDDASAKPDFSARLRVTIPQSLILVAKVGPDIRYLCLSRSGRKEAGAAKAGDRIRYPFMPIPIELEIAQVLDSAQEDYVEAPPGKDRGRLPAVRVTVSSGGDRHSQWVRYGDSSRRFQVGGEPVSVRFAGKRFENLPFEVRLVKFHNPDNPGMPGSPATFRSDVVIEDKLRNLRMERSILVNEPMSIHGYDIYQASWSRDELGRLYSVFQVGWDPGKKILYLGGLMAISGTIFMFFLQPVLKKYLKAGSRAQDPPLTPSGTYAWLATATAGTLAGSLALLVFPSWSALAVGFAVAGADLLLVWLLCLVADRWMKDRPGRSMQLGQIVSAGWCINTAALVILMWMKTGRS